MKAVRPSVVLVIEDLFHSWLDSEDLPAFGSCRAAFGSSAGRMPLPLPLQPLGQVRYHTLVTCLQALHIEDNPSFGASGLTVAGIDNGFARGMAE